MTEWELLKTARKVRARMATGIRGGSEEYVTGKKLPVIEGSGVYSTEGQTHSGCSAGRTRGRHLYLLELLQILVWSHMSTFKKN